MEDIYKLRISSIVIWAVSEYKMSAFLTYCVWGSEAVRPLLILKMSFPRGYFVTCAKTFYRTVAVLYLAWHGVRSKTLSAHQLITLKTMKNTNDEKTWDKKIVFGKNTKTTFCTCTDWILSKFLSCIKYEMKYLGHCTHAFYTKQKMFTSMASAGRGWWRVKKLSKIILSNSENWYVTYISRT